MGSGCGTVVKHMPHDQEVMGSNPAKCKAYFFLLFSQLGTLEQVIEGLLLSVIAYQGGYLYK